MKRSSSKVQTKKLATAAMLCALGVVFLYLGAVVTVLDLTMVALVSFFVFFAVIEMGHPFPLLIYAVTGILSVLILPDKFGAMTYLLFGGVYPIVKAVFERLHPLLSWILKLSFFNTVLSLLIVVTLFVLKVEDSDLGFNVVVYAISNLTFLLYDVMTTQVITLYLVKLRKRLRIEKYFEK